MSHSDPAARPFLEAIYAAPEDDAPRLIYADWLEEAGDTLGEFIRLQCELARLDTLDLRYPVLTARCQQLGLEHRQRLTGPLLDRLRLPETRVMYERGFLTGVELKHSQGFVRHADVIFEEAPLLEHLICRQSDLGTLLQSPAVAQLRRLDLRCEHGDDNDLQQFSESPYVEQLCSLALRGTYDVNALARVDESLQHWRGDIDDLLQCQLMARLTAFECDNCIGTEVLGTSRAIANLESLRVGRYVRPSMVPGILSANSHYTQLRNLSVSHRVFPLLELQEICVGPRLAQLESLALEHCRLHPIAGEMLANCVQASHLQKLDLSHNRLDDAGALALVSAPQLPLRYLQLAHNQLTPAGQAEAQQIAAQRGITIWLDEQDEPQEVGPTQFAYLRDQPQIDVTS